MYVRSIFSRFFLQGYHIILLFLYFSIKAWRKEFIFKIGTSKRISDIRASLKGVDSPAFAIILSFLLMQEIKPKSIQIELPDGTLKDKFRVFRSKSFSWPQMDLTNFLYFRL